MLDKIRKIERVFNQLDKETTKFGNQSGLKCLTNCDLCCRKKGLEANPEHCINLAKTQVPGQTAGCSIYAHRGLICRLFGFSGVRDKNAKLAVYTCSLMKNEFAAEYKQTMERINSDMHIPVVSDFYYQIYYIDPQLANDYNLINVSIRKAIEKVAYYYANKPIRKPRTNKNPQIEKDL